jgi:hypothetical protein
MKLASLFIASALSLYGGACSGIQTGSSLYGPTGNGISWGGFVAGSATSTFRRDISNAPVDPNSATWLNSPYLGNHRSIYPGNGVQLTDLWGSGWEGMSIHYVHGNTQRRMVVRDNPASSGRESYPGDSDPGTFPIPNKPRIQLWYGPSSRPWDGPFLDRYMDPHTQNGPGDQHLFVVDVDNCIDYEAWNCFDDGSNISCGTYSAYYLPGGDLQRPYNLTGGGAVSGLPMVFGFLRYDEFASGSINHALSGTALAGTTTVAFTGAASHAQCCGGWISTNMPFGSKLRLKPGYTASNLGLPPSCAPIITALQKYGVIISDGGLSVDLYPTTGYNWPTDCPPAMRNSGALPLTPAYFDVISSGTGIYCLAGTSGCPNTLPAGNPPVISSFTATPSTISVGQSTTLHWSVSGVVDGDGNPIPLRNISYGPNHKFGPGWVDGPAHGESLLMTPPSAGTYVYQLMVQNRFGRTTANITVTVK